MLQQRVMRADMCGVYVGAKDYIIVDGRKWLDVGLQVEEGTSKVART